MAGCANLGDDMTRDRLWTLLAVLLPVLGATIAPMSTVDLAYLVRVGDLMRASGLDGRGARPRSGCRFWRRPWRAE